MTKKTGRYLSMLLALLAALSGATLVTAAELPARLGEIVYSDARGEGADEGSSRPVVDGGLVKCLSRSAVVRLDDGQVLAFDTNTSAVLDGGPSGRVVARVLSGRVTMIGANGRRLVAGAGSVFAVPPPAEDPATAEALLRQADGAGTDRRARRRSR